MMGNGKWWRMMGMMANDENAGWAMACWGYGGLGSRTLDPLAPFWEWGCHYLERCAGQAESHPRCCGGAVGAFAVGGRAAAAPWVGVCGGALGVAAAPGDVPCRHTSHRPRGRATLVAMIHPSDLTPLTFHSWSAHRIRARTPVINP